MIHKIKYHQPHKRKLTPNLKKTWGTWFFTLKLLRVATRMTESYWNLKFEPNNIRSDPNKIISYPNNSISDPKVLNEIKSLATILKETWGTWFFTPKLMRIDTSMTGGSWNLKFKPNKAISDPRVRNKGSKCSTEMVDAQFSPSSTKLCLLVQVIKKEFTGRIWSLRVNGSLPKYDIYFLTSKIPLIFTLVEILEREESNFSSSLE